jgi:lipopolysaccharide biosynthesis regulator YciM
MRDLPYSTEILILFLIILVLVIIYYLIKKFNIERNKTNDYVFALELLVDGDYKRSIQKFKEAVRKDTENIEAYLRLGDLLRERGFAKNSLKIHRDLTLRSGLKENMQLRVQRSLMLDYEAMGDLENATKTAILILDQTDSNATEIVEKLISLYEKKNKWSEAFNTYKKYFKKDLNRYTKRMALYLVYEGLDLTKEDKQREARIKFREALKIDSECTAAYYYLGKSYEDDDRLNDALTEWKKFSVVLPEKSRIVFEKLERVWFELGSFSEAEKLYNSMISNDDTNLNAGLALARIFDKKGENDKVLDVFKGMGSEVQENVLIQSYKINALFNKGQYKLAVGQAINLLKNKGWLDKENYLCQECQFVSNEPKWICPQCKSIDSFNI